MASLAVHFGGVGTWGNSSSSRDSNAPTGQFEEELGAVGPDAGEQIGKTGGTACHAPGDVEVGGRGRGRRDAIRAPLFMEQQRFRAGGPGQKLEVGALSPKALLQLYAGIFRQSCQS